MAATGWRKFCVIVEVAVHEKSCYNEKDLRWDVEKSLQKGGYSMAKVRGARIGRTVVKQYSKYTASER